MPAPKIVDRWLQQFPLLERMQARDLDRLKKVVHFPVLEPGQVAYQRDWPCPDYVMCVDGRTRVYTAEREGREMLIYNVEGGGSCVLTTQCILTNSTFPAESVAEVHTNLAAIPKHSFRKFMTEIPAFRDFVMADYVKLLHKMFSVIDTIVFASVEQRLARRLLVDASSEGFVQKTHQQLAQDIGSGREIISRRLSDWERKGWIRGERGQIEILDGAAIASLRLE